MMRSPPAAPTPDTITVLHRLCSKLAHPASQTVEEWAGLPTEADWRQWEQEQAEVSERLTLKAVAFDKAMSDPDSLPDPLVPSPRYYSERYHHAPAGYWNLGLD